MKNIKIHLLEFFKSKNSIYMSEQYQKDYNLPPSTIMNKVCQKYSSLLMLLLKIIQFKRD